MESRWTASGNKAGGSSSPKWRGGALRGTALQSGVGLCLAAGLMLLLMAPAQAQYTEKWGDNFAGSAGAAPNPANWTYETGNNWGNGELDYGTTSRSNSYLSGNGQLVIALTEPTAGTYYAGHLATYGLQYPGPYGQIEATIQVPYTDGIGSAFWAMGQNYYTQGVPWPYCGEIDMEENHGGAPTQSNGTIHGYNYEYTGITAAYVLPGGADFYSAFHTFGMNWMPYHIQFTVDGNIYSDLNIWQMYCYQTWPFNQPIFLIDSAGVGGTVSGPPDSTTVFPQYMYSENVEWLAYTAGVPGNPSNLTGTAYSNGVQLNWTASVTAGATYNIYENTANSFTPGDLGELVSYCESNTSLYVSGLNPSTTYYFTVVAQNPGGESGDSNVLTITTSPRGNSGPVYINCGGYGCDKYMADLVYNTGGNAENNPTNVPIVAGVTNAAPSPVYLTERWGPQSYTINNLNPNTLYDVRFHTSETVYPGTGYREFNAFVNGWQTLTNYDIFAATGAEYKADVIDWPAYSDENGVVELDMTLGLKDDPTIDGLEVFPWSASNELPAPPTALTATDESATQINLSWTASTTSGVTYNVYRANTPYFISGAANLLVAGVTTTTYSDTAVPFTGTTYYYRVTALDSYGQSTRSNTAGATTPQSANDLVLAVDAGGSAVGNFVADTDWGGTTWTTSTTATITTTGVTNPAPEAVYQCERYGDVTYYVSGLTPGATYTVRLHNSENYWTAADERQFNVFINGTEVLTNFDIYATAGGSDIANVQQFTVTPLNGNITIAFTTGAYDLPTIKGIELDWVSNPSFAAPTNVNGVSGNAQVSLTWTGVSGATSYNLYRSTVSGGEGTTAEKTGITAASYTDTGLTNNTTYYYTVAALKSGATSPQSVEIFSTPSSSSTGSPPAAPAGLSATGNNASIALTWDASGGATSYYLYRGTASGGEASAAIATGITTPTFTDTTVTNGTTYYYKVAALNSSGTSGMSNEAYATPADTTGSVQIACGSAAALDGFSADTDYSGGGDDSWSGTTIGTSLLTGTIPAQAILQEDREGMTSYTIPGFTANSNYTVTLYFVEQYFTAAGDRVFSVEAGSTTVITNLDIYAAAGQYNAIERSFTATANGSGDIVLTFVADINQPKCSAIVIGSGGGAPDAPTTLTAAGSSAAVALSWVAGTGATSYNVYRGTASGGESATAIATDVTTSSYTNTGLTNGTTYYYEVASVNSYGTSSKSNEAYATPAAASSTIQIDCGSTAAVGSWLADTDYSGGGTDTWGNTIATNLLTGTIPPQGVLQSDREAPTFSYTIPGFAANSNQSITLYFVENYWTAAGGRVFSVDCGSTEVITNLDVYATAGGDFIAIEKTFTGTANASGQIVLTFTASADQAKCGGIIVGTAASGSAPGTPTGLAATAGNATVGLTWTATSTATAYNVFRSTATGGEGTTPYAANVTTTSYTDTAVTNAKEYFYKINAVNSYGSSAQGSEVNATPEGTGPAAPTGLQATGATGAIDLTWTGSTGATSYSVFRGTASGAESATALATNVTAVAYNDTTVANGTTYYYKVDASNSYGASGMSNEASAASAASSAVIQISCGNSSAEGTFVADTDYAGGSTVTVSNTVTTTGVSNPAPEAVYQTNRFGLMTYTIGGLTANEDYTVRLHFAETYFDAAGDRTFDVFINGTQVLSKFDIFATAGGENVANVQQFTEAANASGQMVILFSLEANQPQVNGIEILSAGSKPAAPTSLTATEAASVDTLTWVGSTGATSYAVYRGTASGGESTTALASGITTTTYNDSAVTDGTTYYYKVAALNSYGTSPLSNEASVTPTANFIEINAGGVGTGSWLADTDYSGGGEVAWTNSVATNLLTGTIPPQQILQCDREGVFNYTVTGLAANSNHTVTMYFVEQYFTAAGDRVFSVACNGTTVITSLDIYATAGGDFIAIEKSFSGTANSSGQLNFTFSASVDQPKVSGIVVQ